MIHNFEILDIILNKQINGDKIEDYSRMLLLIFYIILYCSFKSRFKVYCIAIGIKQ